MNERDSRTVLVIEDNPPMLRQIEKHLERAGFSVVMAKDGQEAIGKLYESSPDVIISDINMPVMSGYEFCRKLRKDVGEDIPLIFISVKDSTEDKLLGFDLGGDDYLVKPFAMEELVARVKVNMNRSLKHRRESSTDHLTGLLNRRAMEKWLGVEMRRSQRFKHPFSLAMVDIDHFKSVNDQYGHMAGDEALRKVAAFILGRLRLVDMVGRYGGEEFMILMPETGKENAFIPLERIRQGILGQDILKVDSSPIRVSVSIGVAEFPCDAPGCDEIIAAADAALYTSKAGGRNKVTVFGG